MRMMMIGSSSRLESVEQARAQLEDSCMHVSCRDTVSHTWSNVRQAQIGVGQATIPLNQARRATQLVNRHQIPLRNLM